MSFVRVAAVSIPVHPGNVEANEREILCAMERLEKQGVQLAVFPRLCLTGSQLGDLFWREGYANAAWQALERIAARSANMAAVISLPRMERGRLVCAAAVVQNGSIRALVSRRGLSSADRRWFSEGSGMPLLQLGDAVFSIWQSHASADAVLVPDACGAAHRSRVLRLLAGETVIYANAGFGESTGDEVFDGATAVAEDGELLAQGERFALEGSAAIADLDIGRLQYQRRRMGGCSEGTQAEICVLDAPSDLQLPLKRTLKRLPFVPDTAEELDEAAQIQIMGLASRLRAIRCENIVVGVSGGLDSTHALLIAALAFDRLGLSRRGIHAITMPGMGTGVRTRTNADRLMEALGVSSLEIPIGAAVRQHFADIGHDESLHDVTYENAQARERTQILMDYANKVGGIVLGTGDLSEEALGFCTYNGDHMSMYNVNCTIPKTLMRRLVCHLGDTRFDAAVAAICRDVVDTPISPELLPVSDGELNQRTESILGDYALHDFFLWHLMDSGAGKEKLLLLAAQAFEGQYDRAQIEKQLGTFLWRFRTQQFKRSCAPDGPQATAVTFSPRGGWMMPGDLQGWED